MIKLGDMKLKLQNNVSKREYEFSVTDKKDSKMYYHVEVELEDGVSDGEYTYQLFDNNDKMVAQGLLQIGNYNSDHKTYTESGNKAYKQYNG